MVGARAGQDPLSDSGYATTSSRWIASTRVQVARTMASSGIFCAPSIAPLSMSSNNLGRLGPWWSLFISTGTKYANNSTYKNAWCSGCVARHVERGQSYDQAEIALGNLAEGRSECELRRLGTPY